MKAKEYKRKLLQTEPDKKFIDIDYEKEAAKIMYREGYFMTPKEKAKELINKFWVITGDFSDANECALICVDELISCVPSVNRRPPDYQDINKYTSEYWQEVKQEILKDE